jgi:hypothetical protein
VKQDLYPPPVDGSGSSEITTPGYRVIFTDFVGSPWMEVEKQQYVYLLDLYFA